MRALGLGFAACLLLVSPARAAEEHRELGAHEHGRGGLNIAIEGNRVSIELEAPGMDIVGFEHPAGTPEQKTAIERAQAKFGDPLALLQLPAAAGCKTAEAKVEVESGDHDEKSAGANAAQHTEFHGQYVLECASPRAITSIEFPYFAAFAGAQKLDVAIVTPKGQSKFEVTREKPRLDLAGMM